MSLLALGIKQNSKVITPTNSFIASANCIRMINAKPILCDVLPEDGSIDMKSVTDSADAVIPVHIYGNPCDLDSVKYFADEQNILLMNKKGFIQKIALLF